MSFWNINPYAFGAAAGPSYVITENFSASQPTNWTATGTVNWSADATTLGLEGSHCVECSSAEVAISPTFASPLGEVWVYCQFRTSALANENGVIGFYNGTAQQARVVIETTGAIQIEDDDGTNLGTAGGTILIDTVYHFWFRYKKGTGLNGELDVYHATTDTKPGSTTTFTTAGTATADIDNIRLMHQTATGVGYWDKVRVDDVNIGSAPT